MAEEGRRWFGRLGLFGRSHWTTQLAVLLPVIAVAGMAAWWTMLSSPTNARSQSGASDAPVARQEAVQRAAALPGQPPAAEDMLPAPREAAPTAMPNEVAGLRLFRQSWRRGGLGSKALITFTLRNDNDYAVKDIEIACVFSRRDGRHLTDRRRVIPDAVVRMKSRKTFVRVHIGFVNIYANKAKCAPVAASRI